MALRALICAVLSVWLVTANAAAAPLNTGHVEAELVSARAAIAPGERFTVALRQSIAPGWHTYWRNPGDSGTPTKLALHLPQGFTAGPLQWPAPEHMPFSILVVYVYSGEVLQPVELTAPRNLPTGRDVTLSADVSWLVCSDVCIPEQGALTLTLPVAAQGQDDPHWAPRIAAASAALPHPSPNAAHITSGNPGRLTVTFANAASAGSPEFFAYSQDATDHDTPEAPSYGPHGLSFSVKAGVDGEIGNAPLDGIVAYTGADGVRRAVEIHATPGAPLPGTSGTTVSVAANAGAQPATTLAQATAQAPTENSSGAGVLTAAALAFIAGLILNIMPCVLPVLSIKALSFAGGVHSGRVRREGVLYLTGVLVTFLSLALALVALRNSGDAIGWGFQLQNPLVCAALALLFFAIGLNLLNVFDITGLQNSGANRASNGGDLGAFFTGALAVAAATPCTAPFMAGAIGIALTQSAASTFVIFTALALGFAAPLTLLSFAPGLQRVLPKPGAWMDRFKQVLAFPMFASAAWLAWVLNQQAGSGAALALTAIAIALGFALLVSRWGRVWLAIGVIALALTTAFAWRPLLGQAEAETIHSEPWSAERQAALLAQGQPVFVDFTADWCVTCKLNERLALSSRRVANAFAREHIVFLKADWTNRNPAIAAELAAHGRPGIPLYIYYPPDHGEPIVLDGLLDAEVLAAHIEN